MQALPAAAEVLQISYPSISDGAAVEWSVKSPFGDVYDRVQTFEHYSEIGLTHFALCRNCPCPRYIKNATRLCCNYRIYRVGGIAILEVVEPVTSIACIELA